MKTAARFTLADIARASRAAKEQGAKAVEILRDGTIRLVFAECRRQEETPPEPERPKFRDFEL